MDWLHISGRLWPPFLDLATLDDLDHLDNHVCAMHAFQVNMTPAMRHLSALA
jgi:hypothetical protein